MRGSVAVVAAGALARAVRVFVGLGSKVARDVSAATRGRRRRSPRVGAEGQEARTSHARVTTEDEIEDARIAVTFGLNSTVHVLNGAGLQEGRTLTGIAVHAFIRAYR